MTNFPNANTELPTKTSALAITAFVLSLVVFCFPLGLLGLILGIVSLVRINNPVNRLTGGGFAIAAIVLGAIGPLMIVPMLIGIMLPALGAARRTAQQMQNSTQIRGIHQGMVLYAQGNTNYYPGLDDQGDLLLATADERLDLLLQANFFTAEYLLAPNEPDSSITKAIGSVTERNHSYALLDISTPGGRRSEWQDNANTLAAIMSDRNTGPDAANVESIWTHQPGDWRGGVVFGDNSTVFATSPQMKTRYNQIDNPADHLFDAPTSDDALMIR